MSGAAPVSTLQLGMHWFPERQGGLDRVFYELSRALPGSGIGFRGLIAGGGRSADETGGRVLAFGRADIPIAQRWLGMRRHFMQQEALPVDLIISHFALYTLPVLDRLSGKKLIVHFHGPWADEGAVEGDPPLSRRIKHRMETLVYRRAARCITLSQAFACVLMERYGIPERRIRIIPGGIDSARFAAPIGRAEARARLGWAPDRPVIIAVRRLVPRMGLETLIAAAALLLPVMPDLRLVIAGRGVLRPQLEAQIANAGLRGAVTLAGHVSERDLTRMYRAADLSVVPSAALEGFGLAAAESLAAGTPCLVAPVGGLPEVVSGLSKAMILDAASAPGMARAIHDALLGRMALPDAEACRRYAAQTFDWRVVAAKIAGVYREVLT